MAAKLLVIDNYDSFTFNLVQMFRQFPLDIRVFRSDRITLDRAKRLDPDYILISPGPKDPAHAGISIALVNAFYQKIPILGVCLGMQCINEAFGGQTVRAPMPVHGKTSPIHHCQRLLFSGMPSPFTAARYHSLMVTLSPEALDTALEITARADDEVIMGLSHKHFPLHGVQFHPESFLTQSGTILVENFLRLGPLHAQLSRAA
jgi:anthranilate synthase component 2